MKKKVWESGELLATALSQAVHGATEISSDCFVPPTSVVAEERFDCDMVCVKAGLDDTPSQTEEAVNLAIDPTAHDKALFDAAIVKENLINSYEANTQEESVQVLVFKGCAGFFDSELRICTSRSRFYFFDPATDLHYDVTDYLETRFQQTEYSKLEAVLLEYFEVQMKHQLTKWQSMTNLSHSNPNKRFEEAPAFEDVCPDQSAENLDSDVSASVIRGQEGTTMTEEFEGEEGERETVVSKLQSMPFDHQSNIYVNDQLLIFEGQTEYFEISCEYENVLSFTLKWKVEKSTKVFKNFDFKDKDLKDFVLEKLRLLACSQDYYNSDQNATCNQAFDSNERNSNELSADERNRYFIFSCGAVAMSLAGGIYAFMGKKKSAGMKPK